MSIGSLYQYFPNKEAILNTIIEKLGEKVPSYEFKAIGNEGFFYRRTNGKACGAHNKLFL